MLCVSACSAFCCRDRRRPARAAAGGGAPGTVQLPRSAPAAGRDRGHRSSPTSSISAHDLNIDPAERLLDPAVAAQQSAAIAQLLAARLTVTADGAALTPQWSAARGARRSPVAASSRVRYALSGPPGTLTVTALMFPYDPQHQTFLNVYEGNALTQAILDAAAREFEYFAGTRQGAFAVVQRFLPAGIRHILIGPDHLLFLVGLLLLGGTVRQLAVIVTAFTVAHSITLSLAALNLVSPPARIIEPAIALSIVYVGADNLLIRDGRDVRALDRVRVRLHPRLRLRERAARDGSAARARSAGRCSRSTSASKSVSCWSSPSWRRRSRRCARAARPRDGSSPSPARSS